MATILYSYARAHTYIHASTYTHAHIHTYIHTYIHTTIHIDNRRLMTYATCDVRYYDLFDLRRLTRSFPKSTTENQKLKFFKIGRSRRLSIYLSIYVHWMYQLFVKYIWNPCNDWSFIYFCILYFKYEKLKRLSFTLCLSVCQSVCWFLHNKTCILQNI